MSFGVSLLSDSLEQLPEKQIYRYMGMSEIPQSGEVRELVEKLKPKFLDKVQCKACYMIVPVRMTDSFVDLSVLSVNSVHLARNLAGCEHAILFAATLGMACEQQRRRAAAVSPAEGLVLDAMGSAAIEQFCDRICCDLTQQHSDFHLRPRFSPGYGDFPLEIQKKLLHVLDARRKIGISMSDGYLMIPQKSVTAVVGLSKMGCKKAVPDCESCDHADCEFRL